MKEASTIFLGTHDFRGFCNAHKDLTDETVRTVYSLNITQAESELIFEIFGNSFLYKMVRNIVGTIISIGSGKLDLAAIDRTFRSRKRSLAGVTAPAHGLTLWEVNYVLS